MRLHRFYVKQPLGEELVVDNKDLLHQWNSVFRLKAGDQVLLFSSSPSDFLYSFIDISKTSASLSFVSKQDNVPANDTVLAMALVKKDTFETIVRQATELGVKKIIPVLASRSEKKGLNFERLMLIAQEATEQCGRGEAPQISAISSLEEAIKTQKASNNVVGSLQGESVRRITSSDRTVAVWVGPEGGWTKEEEDLFIKNGFSLMKIADTTLKADTAVSALLSFVSAR